MYVLSWSLGTGVGARGGNKKTESWADVAELLAQVCVGGGTVTLETLGDLPWRNLQLQSENGNLLVTLTDDEGEVRMLDDASTPEEEIEVLGDVYPASCITRDPGTVARVFQQFVEMGDVSAALLR